MSEVFLSYRQTDDAQKQRVRAFAERLRDRGVDVVLDQFFLGDNPAGPNETWAKWSSDRALRSDYVLIIGTPEWFQCFEKTQPPGTGLGAACEADDLRTRIYEAGGLVKNIRVVLFDDADRTHMPGKLRGYHNFHAERDFESIVRWLGGNISIDDTPRTSIPHNLPSLQPFFGREEELKTIADALLQESRTWGALINGPGGIGKTSLAVRAAYDTSSHTFEKIVFISLKSRVLDNDGERDLSGFLISGLAELLNELARELDHDEIAKAPEDQRPRLIHDALRGTRTLLVLDNLESLVKRERDIIFTFVDKLPMGCKAILTARGRIGSGGKEIILQELSEEAALATLAKLAENNSVLQRTSEAERLLLYRETGGNPLLLRWTAGQIGRGNCVTIEDAIEYLRSCPIGNDPLEFIFGDLVENFSEAETRILCALTFFSLPARVEHIIELTNFTETETDQVLRSLTNRSLVVPSDELTTFTLVPLVADFLRKKKPTVMVEMSSRLESQAYALVVENGYETHERFPVIDAAWPIVAAALPCFLAGPNLQLQTVCQALFQPCNYSGRYDESLALNKDAESRAVLAKDFLSAGYRAYHMGWVLHLRGQSAEVLACANRAQEHWRAARAGTREMGNAINLRGLGHRLAKNYPDAIAAHREAAELWRSLESESKAVAATLNNIGIAERMSGDNEAAERNYLEALRIARLVNYEEGISYITGNLAGVALTREDWTSGETFAREALEMAEKIGRQQLIANGCIRLAQALLRQGKKTQGIPYARRAVEIFTVLGSLGVDFARKILAECES
jgi:tetratricopeptide (TPR) repeat protein